MTCYVHEDVTYQSFARPHQSHPRWAGELAQTLVQDIVTYNWNDCTADSDWRQVHYHNMYTHDMKATWIMQAISLNQSCKKNIAIEPYFFYKAKNDNNKLRW